MTKSAHDNANINKLKLRNTSQPKNLMIKNNVVKSKKQKIKTSKRSKYSSCKNKRPIERRKKNHDKRMDLKNIIIPNLVDDETDMKAKSDTKSNCSDETADSDKNQSEHICSKNPIHDKDNQKSDSMLRITDLEQLRETITRKIEILADWKKTGPHMTEFCERQELLESLKVDIASAYEYDIQNVEYMLKLFSPREALRYIQAAAQNRPVTIRVNTLKTGRRELIAALGARNAQLTMMGDWNKVGLVVKSASIPIGATPEYFAGHYIIQSAASLIPVIALDPAPGETIIDLAAAPGGKTTHIAQIMGNSGVLMANDINSERCAGLIANIQRMGITNTIVTSLPGQDFKKHFGRADRVLLDAPCSCSGLASRYPAVKHDSKRLDIGDHVKRQKELLAAAVDLVDACSVNGGIIVYSTCSINVQENEAVIDWILKYRNVKLVPLGVDIGSPGLTAFGNMRFHPSIGVHTKRFYPHIHDMDGFYVAKLKKYTNKIPAIPKRDRTKRQAPTKWGSEHWNNKYLKKVISDQNIAPEINKIKKKSVLDKKNFKREDIAISNKNKNTIEKKKLKNRSKGIKKKSHKESVKFGIDGKKIESTSTKEAGN